MGQDVQVSEPHSPIDALLDRLVFAPLGLVTDARTVVPQLAERGRMQVANAKMMGRFAVQMGSSEAAKRMSGLEGQLRDALVGFGFLPPEVGLDGEPTHEARPAEPEAPSGSNLSAAPDETPRPRPATKKPATKPVRTPTKPKARSAAKPAVVPSVDELAIPGYDSLAASQVVSRLAGLRPAELTAVQRYELHHRGRKTILGRIAQLQAS